jgi:hypothetical protein
MTEHVSVNFNVNDGKREEFLHWLDDASNGKAAETIMMGFRADDFVHRRAALQKFADQMELVLRKHDNKTTWRDKPIEALFKLLQLEMKECKVAMEFFTVADARREMLDIANYAMICWDRLGMLDQDRGIREQGPPQLVLPFSA